MLPEKGPWEHPFYDLPDERVDVAFTDEDGRSWNVTTRHKTLGAGKPIVLVHGLMTSSYSWRYVLAPLAEHYRVLAPDLVGSGESDKPLDLRYSVANVARFIAAYVHAVADEPVYLVGNSLGGLYCLRALFEDPTVARRFVLIHSPGYPLVRTAISSVLFRTPLLGAGARELVARAAHRFPIPFVAKNTHYARKDLLTRENAEELGRAFATLDGARAFAKILDESLTAKEHASIVARLPGWTPPCPIELLYARKDPMVPPSFGPRYAADIPSAKLVWMDDASHFVQVDAPERTVAELLSFDEQ